MITAKQVELRVLEAAETIMILPADTHGGGGWMVVHDEGAYGYNPATYRRRLSPGAISRMEETWSWINNHPDESDRKVLYAWAWHKVRFGSGVRLYAEKSRIKPRTLRWRITRICNEIAHRLTQENPTCVDKKFDEIAESLAYEPADSVADERPRRSPLHMMAPDARPRSLPDSPERQALIEHLTAKAEQRMRKKKRAKT